MSLYIFMLRKQLLEKSSWEFIKFITEDNFIKHMNITTIYN
jgi:hypothetical protein